MFRCDNCGSSCFHDEFEFSETGCMIYHICLICKVIERFELKCWHGFAKFVDCPMCNFYRSVITREFPQSLGRLK